MIGGQYRNRVIERIELIGRYCFKLVLVHENVNKVRVPNVLDELLALLELDGDIVLELVLVHGTNQSQLPEVNHEHLANAAETRVTAVRVLAEIEENQVGWMEQVEPLGH